METFFLSEETFFLLLFLETLDLALVKGSMQHCHQSMQVFREKFSCSMNLHIHILSLVTVSFFTLLLPPIHPSIHQYIHTTIRPRTETQVQLYCPVHGEHAVKAFSPSLLLLASCLHILTPLCVVPTLWLFIFFFQVLIHDALVMFTKHSFFKQSMSLKHLMGMMLWCTASESFYGRITQAEKLTWASMAKESQTSLWGRSQSFAIAPYTAPRITLTLFWKHNRNRMF